MSAAVYQRAAHLASVVLLAVWAGLAHGDAPAAASRPDSAANGRLLFADSFTDSASRNWKFDGDSVWSVVDGRLRARLPAERQLWSFAKVGGSDWRDYAVDFDACGVRGVDKGIAVRMDGAKRGVGIDLRSSPFDDVLMYRGFEHWGHAKLPHKNGTWVHVRVEVRGNRYRAWIEGKLAIDYTDEHNSRARGGIALAAYTGGTGECEVLYDNVQVHALR